VRHKLEPLCFQLYLSLSERKASQYLLIFIQGFL
jgi:hypothetical protein